MPLENARIRLVSVFAQRCVYLFFALLLLLIMVPFLEDTPRGRIVLNLINIVILFTAAVAVSRSRVCFVFAVALAVRLADDQNVQIDTFGLHRTVEKRHMPIVM